MSKFFSVVNLLMFLVLPQAIAQEKAAEAKPPECRNGAIYRVCGDQQRQDYKDLVKEIKELKDGQDQRILIVLGFEGCPWCRSLNKFFSSDEGKNSLADKKLRLLEISILDSNRKISASGYEILTQALLQSIDTPRDIMKGQEAYPLIVVLDPKKKASVIIRTGALELNTSTSRGHDYGKVTNAIDQALERLSLVR